jgi:hypothetical protein
MTLWQLASVGATLVKTRLGDRKSARLRNRETLIATPDNELRLAVREDLPHGPHRNRLRRPAAHGPLSPCAFARSPPLAARAAELRLRERPDAALPGRGHHRLSLKVVKQQGNHALFGASSGSSVIGPPALA